MAAISDYEDTTALTKTALAGPFGSFLSYFFLGGPEIQQISEWIPFVSLPILTATWDFLYPSPFPAYASRAGVILTILPVLFIFPLRYYWSDRAVEEWYLVILVVLSPVGAILVNYPLAPVPIFLGLCMIFLSYSFSKVLVVLIDLWTLPKETKDEWLKTKVLIGGFSLAFIFTFVVSFLMRAAQYCAAYRCL